MTPTTTTIDLRWLTGSKIIFVTLHYSGCSNENMETKWCLDKIQKMERHLGHRHLECRHLEFVKNK